jgi:hypothetical protein
MHGSTGPLALGAAIGLVLAMSIAPERNLPANLPAGDPVPVLATTEADPAVRLGVYDSRGIAIAWAQSEHSDIREKKAAHREAKAAGDEVKAAALERWGELHQRELHFQGFGSYPVDRYIADIKGELPALLEARGLDAIVWMEHAHAERVEVVDVTVDLMVLLGMDPDAAAKTAGEMKKHTPLDFATLFEMDPRD